MGLGSDSCKELGEVAREVDVNRGQKLTVTNKLEGEKGREPQSLRAKLNQEIWETNGDKDRAGF